ADTAANAQSGSPLRVLDKPAGKRGTGPQRHFQRARCCHVRKTENGHQQFCPTSRLRLQSLGRRKNIDSRRLRYLLRMEISELRCHYAAASDTKRNESDIGVQLEHAARLVRKFRRKRNWDRVPISCRRWAAFCVSRSDKSGRREGANNELYR